MKCDFFTGAIHPIYKMQILKQNITISFTLLFSYLLILGIVLYPNISVHETSFSGVHSVTPMLPTNAGTKSWIGIKWRRC